MRIIGLFLLLLCGAADAQEKACTTTLSPGANVASTINAASGGAVICLNNGTYTMGGNVTARPSSQVVIRSLTSARGATISTYPNTINNTANLTFKWLNMGGHDVTDNNTTPKTSYLSYVGNSFSGPVVVNMGGATGDTHMLFSGNLFQPAWNTDALGSEVGVLYLTCNPQCWTAQNAGVRVEHNIFDGTDSCADGIQITGGHKGVTIGPGNIFRNWTQPPCEGGPHVDAWQIVDGVNVTVQGNYFTNNSIHIGLYDGSSNVVVSNNIFNGQNSGSVQVFQIGGIQGMTFAHNTLKDITYTSIGTKSGQDPNSSWIIENNILVNSNLSAGGDQQGCGSGCIVRYNQLDSSSSILTGATNTNNTTATTVFVSGTPSSPSSPTDSTAWATWALHATSPGKGTGNDGKDRGVLFRNPAAPTGIN